VELNVYGFLTSTLDVWLVSFTFRSL